MSTVKLLRLILIARAEVVCSLTGLTHARSLTGLKPRNILASMFIAYTTIRSANANSGEQILLAISAS